MATSDVLDDARRAYARKDWKAAANGFAEARAANALGVEDFEPAATAARLVGDDLEIRETLAQGYSLAVVEGEQIVATRLAFWLSHVLMFAGEESQCSAWLARAKELLDAYGRECCERGYIRVLEGVGQLFSGEPATAEALFAEARDIGRAFSDPTLLAMAGHGQGRALIALGRYGDGMAVLDEVMVTATREEVSPFIVGDAYCGLLEACHDVFDVRRAREWTAALTRWCESQPDLVPYRGTCMVYRAELMRLQGAWGDALDEAHRACEWLSSPSSPEGPGGAHYQLAELHRLRGEFAEAEAAYREASRCGCPPEPGLLLLWLAQGRTASARTAVSRAIEEAGSNHVRRAELLGASAEIMLRAGDANSARAAATELAEMARKFDAPLLHATADRAMGRVLIAEGSAFAALAPLKRAWTAWQRIEAPYEAAQERVQIGIAYRELGDRESAAMEFDAARWVFQELGAAPELAKLDEIAPPEGGASGADGLTPREVEVLRLVAEGRTNKEIAAALVISEHTVARHVQNMLAKLGFASRARLAAFAIERVASRGK